jgi:hypothetical protein
MCDAKQFSESTRLWLSVHIDNLHVTSSTFLLTRASPVISLTDHLTSPNLNDKVVQMVHSDAVDNTESSVLCPSIFSSNERHAGF